MCLSWGDASVMPSAVQMIASYVAERVCVCVSVPNSTIVLDGNHGLKAACVCVTLRHLQRLTRIPGSTLYI